MLLVNGALHFGCKPRSALSERNNPDPDWGTLLRGNEQLCALHNGVCWASHCVADRLRRREDLVVIAALQKVQRCSVSQAWPCCTDGDTLEACKLTS